MHIYHFNIDCVSKNYDIYHTFYQIDNDLTEMIIIIVLLVIIVILVLIIIIVLKAKVSIKVIRRILIETKKN